MQIIELNKISVPWTWLRKNMLKNYANQLFENLKKKKVYSGFKDNIWGDDLADMQLISKFDKGLRFLLCVIDIFRKYAWVVPLKEKKVLQLLMLFRKCSETLIENQTKYELIK